MSFTILLCLLCRSGKKEHNPLEEFCGVLSDEDAAVMMSAIDEYRRIEPDEW